MIVPGTEKKEPYKRLAEINRAITTSLNFDEVLDLIVENATQLVGARITALLLVDQNGLLRIRAARGLDSSLVNSFSGVMEEDVIEQLRRSLAAPRKETLVAVPVIAKNSLNGLLVIVRDRPFDEEEKWQVSALADQAAIALSNARLFELELAELIRARDASEHARRRLAAIVESSNDAIISKDLDGIINSWNQGAQRVFGYTAEEMIGQPVTMLIPQDRTDEESTILKRLRAGQRIEHFETVRMRKDGSLINVSLTISPVKDEQGRIVGASKIARDISASKLAEEQLSRAVKFDEAVMLGMGEGLFTVDAEGLVTFMNPAAQKLFGWTLEELRGKKIHEETHYLHPDGTPFPPEECPGLLVLTKGKTLSDYEDVFIRKDGTYFPVIFSSSPLREGEKITGLVVVFRDVSERKKAEQSLADRARLLDLSNDAIIVRDINDRIMYWNRGAEETYGWTAEEALGQMAHELRRTEHPEPLSKILEQFYRDNRWTGEIAHVRRDGMSITTASRWALQRDDLGRPAYILETNNDITDRKLAEVEREEILRREHEARQSAEQANKLKDEFLATLSHELRNPLNVILGYSEVLLRNDEVQQSAFLKRAVEILRRNAETQSQLVSDLLDLSRLHTGKLSLNREAVSLTTIVHNAVETVRTEAAAKNLQISVNAQDEVLFVNADPLRLGQVIWNLLNNAVKFTPTGGRVVVDLSRDEDEALVIVKDTGEGIDPKFAPYLFEIFRQADATSSRRHSGMGIGLALVQQLVALHNGSVAMESAGPGRGAKFTIRLPLSRETREGGVLEELVDVGALDQMRILVVDDSADSVEMLRRLFEMDGATVSTAGGGAEALEIIREQDFEVILSDISMPEMDGFEFLRRLREIPEKRDVPVLALTGFGRAEDVERAKAEGFFTHVTKPIDVNKLVGLLRALPDRERSGKTGAQDGDFK
ncbi:MAG: PAS domain S-box protein [Pyrinomonadaceae bacterium]